MKDTMKIKKTIMTLLLAIGLILTATDWSFAEVWFEDSFEGTPPTGWSAHWIPFTNTHSITTSELTPPTDGGVYAFRQDWLTSGGAGWLYLGFGDVPAIPNLLGDGDEFYLSYYIYYDANFDWGSTTGFKQVIVQSNSRTDDRMYILLAGADGRLVIYFQTTGDPCFNANVNGGRYLMPKGQWVKFDWYVKVSPKTKQQGILKGWVNGVLRWDYSNISTIEAGSYNSLWIDRTFNEPIYGANQKRYWDLFSISSGSQGKPGDVNGDGRVSVQDMIFIAIRFGARQGDAAWDPRADLNGNGVIDVTDLVTCARHFGE